MTSTHPALLRPNLIGNERIPERRHDPLPL